MRVVGRFGVVNYWKKGLFNMYRKYENPAVLQEMLDEAEFAYRAAVENGWEVDDLIDMAENIAELRDRINHAYQDEEFEEEESKLDVFYL